MKKIKETKEKKITDPTKKNRFNAIDALIVILVVACIAGIVLRYTVLDDLRVSQEQKDFYITFTVSSLTYEQFKSIVAMKDESEIGGNWVYLSDGETRLGELTVLDEQNKDSLTFIGANGETVNVPYSEDESEEYVTWTVTGKILCKGVYSENGSFLLNGKQYLGANMVVDVYTKYCDFSIKITDIAESLA